MVKRILNKEIDSGADNFRKIFYKPAIRIGFITLLAAIVLSFLPNLYLFIKYGAYPPLSVAMKSWGMVLAVFGAMYIFEPFSYYPILGLTGTYMSFLSGSIPNVKLPASAAAQEAVGVEAGSHEAEIISTLGIAGAITVQLIVVTIGAFAGVQIIKMMPESMKMALEMYTVPAIFGALFIQFAKSSFKIALIALPIPFISMYILKIPASITVIICIFGTIGISRVLYKANLL